MKPAYEFGGSKEFVWRKKKKSDRESEQTSQTVNIQKIA